ncbi:hypothetical protein [Sinomonas sp. P47F7]|uniref:hypothetical protein n=1 Tax=Sinomonas sp. P47F7 TaxID=3410987 RepID=UPI003BF4FFD6
MSSAAVPKRRRRGYADPTANLAIARTDRQARRGLTRTEPAASVATEARTEAPAGVVAQLSYFPESEPVELSAPDAIAPGDDFNHGALAVAAEARRAAGVGARDLPKRPSKCVSIVLGPLVTGEARMFHRETLAHDAYGPYAEVIAGEALRDAAIPLVVGGAVLGTVAFAAGRYARQGLATIVWNDEASAAEGYAGAALARRELRIMCRVLAGAWDPDRFGFVIEKIDWSTARAVL